MVAPGALGAREFSRLRNQLLQLHQKRLAHFVIRWTRAARL